MPKSATALAIKEDHLPDYMNATSSRGNENVGSQLIIPQVKQLQKMSHEVDKYNPKFIEGAEPGMFLNVLTGELYKDAIHVLNVNFSPYYQVKSKYGVNPSVYLGKFRDYQEAVNILEQQEERDRANLEIADGHTHLLVMLNSDGGIIGETPVIFDFTGSKMRVSKNWNSQITAHGGDRFSSVWKISSVTQEGRMGAFLNIKTENVGWAKEEAYKAAEAMYKQYTTY